MSWLRRDSIESRWATTILVCRKCTKRLDGGFGKKGRTSLAKLLRKHAGGGWRRKAAFGVVEARCLGVCPRDAVVVVDGAHPGRWQLIRAGTPVEDVLERLGLGEAGVEEAAPAPRS